MSNEVLPRLPGQTLKQGRSPRWRNTVRESGSGRTFARSHWTTVRRDLRLEYEFLRAGAEAELQHLEGFFNRHKGNGDTWLFDDENDRSVVAEPFGIGSGTATAFQLVRARGGFVEPIYELNGAPLIYLNGNPAGTNLLVNPSFELGGGGVATGWAGYTSGSVVGTSSSLQTDSPAFGTKVQRIQANSTGTANARIGVSQQVFNLTAGKMYTFSGMVRYRTGVTPASNLRITAFVSFRNASDVQVGSAITDISSPGSTFVLASCTAVAPANTSYAYVYFWVMALVITADSFSIDIDGAQFIEGSARTDFDASRALWTVSPTGLVTFDSAYPPPAAAQLTWTGSYYWRCRFKLSELDLEQFLQDLWELRRLEFTTEKP